MTTTPLLPALLASPDEDRALERLTELLSNDESPMLDRRGDQWRVWIQGFAGPRGCWKPTLLIAIGCMTHKLAAARQRTGATA